MRVVGALGRADAVLVSGGNTLFAIDRWTRCGLAPALREAMERGAVLCGGSAGAICWFDAGHSDSMDPDSYADAMLGGAGMSSATYEHGPGDKKWDYVRCPCLGFLPGLVCPHHDRTQSNGLLRAEDFDAMLRRHPGERGVCIDHFAALCIDGPAYSVLSLPGKEGTFLPGSTKPDFSGAGAPAMWIKTVQGDDIVCEPVPPQGTLVDILKPATHVVEDPRIPAARQENPSDRDRP